MTRAQALLVTEGTIVISKFTTPAFKPLTVTHAWANEAKTILRFRTKELGERWLDPEGLDLAPAGQKWNRATMAWVPGARRERAS